MKIHRKDLSPPGLPPASGKPIQRIACVPQGDRPTRNPLFPDFPEPSAMTIAHAEPAGWQHLPAPCNGSGHSWRACWGSPVYQEAHPGVERARRQLQNYPRLHAERSDTRSRRPANFDFHCPGHNSSTPPCWASKGTRCRCAISCRHLHEPRWFRTVNAACISHQLPKEDVSREKTSNAPIVPPAKSSKAKA